MSIKKTKLDAINARIESGEIIEQKSWKYIQELNSYSEESLDAVALVDGRKEYTYRQMFRKWENYAEVFSALDITEKNHSRVGVLSAPAAEPTMVFYALNMTGASVSMIYSVDIEDRESWNRMIEKEGITDLLLCDFMLQPEQLHRILSDKEALGLRNIIVLHVRVAGPFAPLWMQAYSHLKYQQLKSFAGALFMDDLLKEYEATPIVYGSSNSRDDALILHTSGTTNGVHKPIPLSDRGFNEAVARLLRNESLQSLRGSAVCCLGMELSASYAAVDMMHLPFAFGGTLITLPLGLLNPQFAASIQRYRINVLLGASPLFESWLKMPVRWDLSSLKLVWIGGEYVSPDAKQKYNEYLKQCGADARISIGYGLTEIGGACIIASPDRDDDAIGYPMSGVKVRIFDENEEKYYDLEDGARTGVMFLSSPSLSSGRIDDTVFFKLDEIDGETYLNTYDLVRVNEDGSLNCVGRMNKYFVNNEGIRFDAGLVETAVSAQPDITGCGLAPGYYKAIHDTIPVLYVQTRVTGAKAPDIVRKALYNVFIHDNKIAETNLPGQCVITDSIPLTTTGKVDVYKIVNSNVKGTRYKVEPVRKQGKLTDIQLIPVSATENLPGMWAGAPDELAKQVDTLDKLVSFGKNGFLPPQGLPLPNLLPQGLPLPNILPQGKDNQPPQGFPFPPGWPFPILAAQGKDNQPPQGFPFPPGWPFPILAAQGENNQPPQGFPFLPGLPLPNLAAQGMNFQAPQGLPLPNIMPQGLPLPNIPPQGFPFPPGWPLPFMPIPDMGSQQENENTRDENAGQAGMEMPKIPGRPIMNLMRQLFHASDVDYFYED